MAAVGAYELDELVGLARDKSQKSRSVLVAAVNDLFSDEEELHPGFGPGSLCPLCRFPTHEWAENTEHLSQLVKEEYPEWEPLQGICTQCANRYLFTAAFSMNPPNSPNQIMDRNPASFHGLGMEDI